MKKIVLFLFIPWVVLQAQTKHKTSDFNLSSDVVKYETAEYYYDSGNGNFKKSAHKTYTFSNGLLQKLESTLDYFVLTNTISEFRYKNNLLHEVISNSEAGGTTETYTYTNKKLTEIISENEVVKKYTFEYDSKGNVLKEFVYEDGILIQKNEYSNYTTPNSYKKKMMNCYGDTDQGTYYYEYKNGCMISEKADTEYLKSTTVFQYDKYKNQIAQTIDGKLFSTSYVYDKKGNVLKSQILQPGFDLEPDQNYYTFAKITYKDGKTVGTIDLDKEYIKKFEKQIKSFDVAASSSISGSELSKAISDLKADLASKYQIMKHKDNTFSIKDANGEEITNDVTAVKSKTDILLYDILFKKDLLLKNFYTDSVKIEQWYSMEEMTSPTGYYWIFSEAPEFFVIKNGVLADMSLYKVVKTEKEDDFIIQEAGIDKYIIKDLKSKGFETFYPLEFLNK